MKRSIGMALSVVLATLAVPAAALATKHHAPLAPSAVATVSSYSGTTLTLTLSSGGTIAGQVTGQTRFICLGTGGFGRGRGFFPQRCDSSQLVNNEGVLTADAQITANGVQFSTLVLLPPVPSGPITV
jgi:hypothetical protein